VKKALILVPGLLCDETVWAAQIRALRDVADIQVANHDDLDSLKALAESIIAHGPARFAIAGHSMGGRIAAEVARMAPERLTGFAILDSGHEPLAKGDGGARETAVRHALLGLARRDGMRVMGRKWLQGMVHPARLEDRELVDGILDMIERRTPAQFERQIRGLLARPDAMPVLVNIQCPALVLCGREDTWAPPSRHSDMAARMRGSTLSIIPDCGHMATLERPQAVNAAMQAWLRRVE